MWGTGPNWRKLTFFDKVPVEPASGLEAAQEDQEVLATCCGRGLACVGFSDGTVRVCGRSLLQMVSFPAHSGPCLFLHHLKRRSWLLTLGRDEGKNGPATTLKVWDMEKLQSHKQHSHPDGLPPPTCLRSVKIFDSKKAKTQPEAKVCSFDCLEEASSNVLTSPLVCAFGLSNGSVQVHRGDFVRSSRQSISKFDFSDDAGEVSSVKLHLDSEGLVELFVTTVSRTRNISIDRGGLISVLDEQGSARGCSILSDSSELVVGRDEAVYFYDSEGRGPCLAFSGQKHTLAWFRGHLITISGETDQKTIVTVYDLRNKLIAFSDTIPQAKHCLCEWGVVTIITVDGKAFSLSEKDSATKLEMLFKKNLYSVAVNLTQIDQQDTAATAEVLRKFGDHLYKEKQDYDGAMAQYERTIGWLEPSYVIRKFLDAQRIHNLTTYLEKLHSRGLADADHTTLLLNCYTKLKDVSKLDSFLVRCGKTDDGALFDVVTAIKVCRSAGYSEQSLMLAKHHDEKEWYLRILIEDLSRYDEALEFLDSIPALLECERALMKYGKALVMHRAEATTALLMRLCTVPMPLVAEAPVVDNGVSEMPSHGSFSSNLDTADTTGMGEDRGSNMRTSSPMSFVHLFVESPSALMLFFEFIINSSHDKPPESPVFNTLLELYLSDTVSQKQSDGGERPLDSKMEDLKLSGQGSRPGHARVDSDTGISKQVRLERALDLLKRGWPQANQDPLYDAEQALVLCRLRRFQAGCLFLYERQRLYTEALACYMQEEDYEGLLDCCRRFGDASRGGEPTLWIEVLKYFSDSARGNCVNEVQQVLQHIEQYRLLPPLIVLQMLAKNEHLTLAVVKDYVVRQLQDESAALDEDRKAISKYQLESQRMQEDVDKLRSQATTFKSTKCTACQQQLDLPSVHFFCMHSFHQRCLGDNEHECPVCAPANRTVLDVKKNLQQHAGQHDRFFQQLHNATDGFAVVAEYFGRGLFATQGADGSNP